MSSDRFRIAPDESSPRPHWRPCKILEVKDDCVEIIELRNGHKRSVAKGTHQFEKMRVAEHGGIKWMRI